MEPNTISSFSKLIHKIGFFEVSHSSTLVSGVLFVLWISYFISLEAVGIFGIWITASLLLSQIGCFGFNNAITYYGTSNLTTIKGHVKSLHWQGSIYSLIINLIITMICLNLAAHGMLFESIEFALLLALNVAIISQTKLLVARSNVTGNAKIVAVANFIKSASMLMLIFLSFALEFSTNAQLKIFLISEGINCFALLLLTPRIINKDKTKKLQLGLFAYLKNSFGFAINNFIFDATTKVDMIMVSIFMPISIVGLYTIIMNITEGFFGFSVLKRGEFYNYLLEQIKHGRVENIKKFYKVQYHKFCLLAVPIFIAGCIFLAMVSQAIDGVPVIALGLNILGILLISPSILTYNLFFSLKKTGVLTGYISLSIATNIVLNYLLIPLFGIIGASLGTLISFAILALLVNKFIIKVSHARETSIL